MNAFYTIKFFISLHPCVPISLFSFMAVSHWDVDNTLNSNTSLVVLPQYIASDKNHQSDHLRNMYMLSIPKWTPKAPFNSLNFRLCRDVRMSLKLLSSYIYSRYLQKHWLTF